MEACNRGLWWQAALTWQRAFKASPRSTQGRRFVPLAAKRCRLLLVYCKQMNVANALDCCSAGEYLGCFSWQFLLFLREKWPLPSLQWFLWLPMAASIHRFRHGIPGLVAVCAQCGETGRTLSQQQQQQRTVREYSWVLLLDIPVWITEWGYITSKLSFPCLWSGIDFDCSLRVRAVLERA